MREDAAVEERTAEKDSASATSAAGPALRNQRIIVTGAGSGIGAATARLAAAQGAAVAAADIDGEAAEQVAGEIRAAGGTAAGLAVDVSEEVQVQRMFAEAAAQLGPITGVVNNAGIIVTKLLVETTQEDWDRCLDINARGVFFGCKHAVLHFREHGVQGSIVNTGSISALTGQHRQAAYAASKGAVVQLTRQVAVEHAAEGIRCNSVGPGSVHSAVLESFLGGQDDPAAAERRLAETHPMHRIGHAEEIAAANCFLLSPAASFITGANLQADGGYTAA